MWNKEQRLVDRAAGSVLDQSRSSRNARGIRARFFSARTSVSTFGSRAARVGFRKTRASFCSPRKIVRRSVRKTPRASGCVNLEIRASWLESAASAFVASLLSALKMAALSAVAPVLNKAPVVSTGKAANTNSMMVWQPHGNKCVSPPAPARVSHESMLVLKYGFFPRSRLARVARRDRGVAPRRIGAARCPDPVDRSIGDRSSSRDRAFARTRDRDAPSPDRTRAVFRSARSFSRRAYPIPLERAPFRPRGGRGRLVPGRPRAERSRATVCGTPPRRCPRRRLEGSSRRRSPAFSRFRVSERRLADRGFFPNAIGPFRRPRTPSRSILERFADSCRFIALPLPGSSRLSPSPPLGPGDRPPGAVPPQQRLDSLHRVRVRREGVLRLPRLDRR